MAQTTLVKGAYVTKKTLILRHNSFSFCQGVIIWAYIYMYHLKRCPTVIMPYIVYFGVLYLLVFWDSLALVNN